MEVEVTCSKCHNVVIVESDVSAGDYLNIEKIECPICGHEFKMKFVRFFDEQRN